MHEDMAHPSPEELLRAADGEMPRPAGARYLAHLASCAPCRARLEEARRVLAELAQAGGRADDPQLPSPAWARARLKARIAESERAGGANGARGIWLSPRGLASACAVALLGLLCARLLPWPPAGPAAKAAGRSGLLPDARYTPGTVRSVALRDLCAEEHDQVVRPVRETLRKAVLREYGVEEAAAENYELDYLVSPGLGGVEDVQNIWPQPRFNASWNSFVKDELEDYLHRSVCSGTLSLSVAQQDVASDWIAAYKRYFHTDFPLRPSASSPEGEPRLRAPGSLRPSSGSGSDSSRD